SRSDDVAPCDPAAAPACDPSSEYHHPRQQPIIDPTDKPSFQPTQPPTVLLHAHCYQKARLPAADGYPVGAAATQAMLEALGFRVQLIDSGCCGMAGAFGYEAEHYALSQQVGELALLPAVRAAGPGVLIAACGISCQAQIEDSVGRHAVHPVCLAAG
ncbi:MAG TPA: heterodisulfide reductase-related iron-sulfur binding cluster, partial [Anaerolineales bacterium]